MKKIIPLITIMLLFSSCGNEQKSIDDILASKDVKTIQEKKDELVSQQQALNVEIKRLDDTLKSLSPDRNIPLVTQFKTKAEDFVHFVEFQGSVETKQNLMVSPEISGFLENVFVKEGDEVSEGQLLAKIDDSGLAQQLAQLKIQRDLAKTTFERQERLWNQNIGSEMQYLNAKSNYESLVQNVNQIDKQLRKTSIRAPFNGIVDNIITEEGNVVSAGMTSILRLINLSDMYITVDVPEKYLQSVSTGKKVEIYLPVLGRTANSTVRQAGNFINPANRTFRIEVEVPNPENDIKPNITARVKINDYNNENAILIPQSIISENAEGEQYVYAIQDNDNDNAKVKQVIIETGKTQGDYIEIIDGLKPEMKLVKEGARSVKDGQVVKVAE
jgi:RND family efflux transporter MFP subunit